MKKIQKSHPDDLARKWLQDYLNGKIVKQLPLTAFDFSQATPFQIKVWKTLLKIPYGQVRSYGWICKQLGLKGGAQAVGQANKRNPYPILIPCHRVIAADGTIGGYAYGVEMKRALLKLEGVVIEQ